MKKRKVNKKKGVRVRGYLIAFFLVIGLVAIYSISSGGSSSELDKKVKNVNFPDYATQNPVILKAYKIAVAEPALLQAIPCYCGCKDVRNYQFPEGHKSLYNCYLDDSGRFTSHAAYCDICLNEATESYSMFKKGYSLQEIRKSIDSEYAGRYGEPTPTPPV